MAKGKDAFGAALRGEPVSGSSTVVDDSADPSGVATEALNACIEGLAAIHAVIDELSNQNGTAADEKLPSSASQAYRQALSALDILHVELDSILEDHGLEPTTAFDD